MRSIFFLFLKNVTATTNFLQNHFEDYLYKITVYVVPEEEYTFKVYAVNENQMKGEHIMVTQVAPAGVPANIEETLDIAVIALQREKAVGERQITLTLVRDFFEESTNGKVQATGLIVCINNCDLDGGVKITDVNAMENWAGASKKGSMSYRATTPEWLDKAHTQCACGRNKREVTNIEYIVGSEDCTNVSPDEFCNGPLKPGTSYKFVAFSCTNGGCLFSRQYGPFTTAKSEAVPCDAVTGSTQTVIVGVVLGLVIVVLLVYAGFMTYLVRRYRAKDEQEIKLDNGKDRKSQTYVNETFMTGSASNTSGNLNVDSGVESVYSRLDDNVREDKTTYESLRP
ncbi:uncharacterized protein LOC132733737 [Ruditapes philippinarum]|uniref:uncharacterized protein LOC132733737 n=1 Tax=Ruditapes philippinarum TaxID=129788 RepID=UPI00295A9C5F|nr:uncharacterized protein LOC132733737 [Ruditapes philippinarum]